MKSFIFDFDGVIVDSEIHWDKLSLGSYQEIIPAFDKDYDRTLKGRSVHDIYTMLVRDFNLSLSKEQYMAHIQKLTEKIYGELCQPLPGIIELAERVHACGFTVGIASSSQRDWIERTLERFDLQDTFGPIITAQDVGIGKPDPAVYLEAARRVGTPPEDCIALEDSTNGVKSAKAAGMTCVGIRHTWGYTQDLSAADRIIDHFDELTTESLMTL